MKEKVTKWKGKVGRRH